MKFLKDLIEFWRYCFLGTLIRPIYKLFKAMAEEQEWVNKKLSEENYFKEK
jgi:hypothetical protein